MHGRNGNLSGSGGLINNGKISADVAGGHLIVQPGVFVHNGTAEVINSGQLTFGGNWSGAGAVDVVNGTFNLGGQFGPVNIPVTKGASGIVRVTGAGNLQGSTLTLNAATGSWSLDGGTLANGVLTLEQGAEFKPGASFANVLDNMTVNGAIALDENCVLLLRNGLALNGVLSMNSGAYLRFINTQTISAGTFAFTGATAATIDIQPNANLTFAAPVILRGRNGNLSGSGGLINSGKISADVAYGHLRIQPATFAHNGTAEVINSGQLTFGGNWSGAGSVNVLDGAFNLGGQFGPVNTSITKGTSGIVRVTGAGNLQNSTLTLNAATGSWSLDGGTLANGALSMQDGAQFKPTASFANVLENLTINGNVPLDANCVLIVRGGMTLNGVMSLAEGSYLRFGNTQTINSGTFAFTGTTAATVDIQPNANVTFSAPVVVRGRSGNISGSGGLISNGTISADVAGGNINMQPATFVHNGTAEVMNGGQLTFGGNWSGAGSVNVVDGTFNLGGQFGPVNIPVTKGAAGNVRVTGAGNLQGSTLALNATTGSWSLDGGTLANGTIALVDAAELRPTASFGNVLDNIVVNGNLLLADGSVLILRNGFSLTSGGILSLNSGAYLRFANGQPFTGTINFAGTAAATIDIQPAAVVTLAPSSLVHGRSGNIGGSGTLVNQGKISADTAGGTIRITSQFVNEGQLEAINGGVLIAPGFP